MGNLIILIVEGISDRSALEAPLLKINEDVAVHVANGDFLYKKSVSSVDNPLTALNRKLKEFLEENKLKPKDILRVSYLIDTDGVFIDQSHYFLSKKELSNKVIYEESRITIPREKELDKHLKTVTSRQVGIERLVNTKQITIPGKRGSKRNSQTVHSGFTPIQVPFSLYYMSCNLEHVTSNQRNSNSEEKINNAHNFKNNHENDFKKFFDNNLCPAKDYQQSWQFIHQETNSLKRYSNFSIFINSLLDD